MLPSGFYPGGLLSERAAIGSPQTRNNDASDWARWVCLKEQVWTAKVWSLHRRIGLCIPVPASVRDAGRDRSVIALRLLQSRGVRDCEAVTFLGDARKGEHGSGALTHRLLDDWPGCL